MDKSSFITESKERIDNYYEIKQDRKEVGWSKCRLSVKVLSAWYSRASIVRPSRKELLRSSRRVS